MYAVQRRRIFMTLRGLHDTFCIRTMHNLQSSRTIMYKNPCLDLQQHLEIPIFKAEETCFNPSVKSMQSAEELFVPRKHHVIKCIIEVVDPKKFPDHELPEVIIHTCYFNQFIEYDLPYCPLIT